MKHQLTVFDSPTSGSGLNPVLMNFAGDLDRLKSQGVSIQRYNLSSDPAAFIAEPIVQELIAQTGHDCLPVILLNGKLVSQGRYPSRIELLEWTGTEVPQSKLAACKPGSNCNCG